VLPLKKIQLWMKKNNKDLLIINRTDEFLNEYIAAYAERLKWITNFTGSAGRAIIETKKAYIFIDGRYTHQAKQQVDSNFFFIKHLKDYWSHLKTYEKTDKVMLIDPNLHSVSEIIKLNSIYKDSKVYLNFVKKNPIDVCWEHKPLPPNSLAFLHLDKYAGENSINKIKRIQNKLKINSVDHYILSNLESIAWLLNIRGNDIKYSPLLFCYAIIPCEGKVELFIDKKKINPVLKKINHYVNFNLFENIEKYIRKIDLKKIIGMDESSTPYNFKNICKNQNLIINNLQDPCLYPKAIKNSTELKGAREANIRDGVSISKFLYWIKKKMNVLEIDEISASNYLLKLRKKNKLYFSQSFETISAFGLHAALPHYKVSKESNMLLSNNSMYLIDSGAQYKDGTTDITRTIIIGKPTTEQKDRFTRVLKGHIAIAKSKFKVNTSGNELDASARKSLQEINCDYAHGTGHGVGSFLSVHEGPQCISNSNVKDNGIIKNGMILSNEPGFYKEGEYGIRIENLIICCSDNKDHLYFETISWAPIDKNLIDISLLNQNEALWLNNYHEKVYEKLNYYLNKEERDWLRLTTAPINK